MEQNGYHLTISPHPLHLRHINIFPRSLAAGDGNKVFGHAITQHNVFAQAGQYLGHNNCRAAVSMVHVTIVAIGGLEGAILYDAICEGAILSAAICEGAILSTAICEGAILCAAICEGAILYAATGEGRHCSVSMAIRNPILGSCHEVCQERLSGLVFATDGFNNWVCICLHFTIFRLFTGGLCCTICVVAIQGLGGRTVGGLEPIIAIG